MQALVYHCRGKRVLKNKNKSKPIIDKKGMFPHWEDGGCWIAGKLIDTITIQSPFADITPNAIHDAQTAVLLDTEQQGRIAQAMPTRPMNGNGHTIVARVRPRLLK